MLCLLNMFGCFINFFNKGENVMVGILNGSEQKISSKERKAFDKLSGVLQSEFNVPSEDIQITMVRDVPGHRGGCPIKEDEIEVRFLKAQFDEKGVVIGGSAVQQKLADALMEVWPKNRPLVNLKTPILTFEQWEQIQEKNAKKAVVLDSENVVEMPEEPDCHTARL